MFNKTLKETIRVQGDVQRGTAEVIKTIRTANDPVEMFAFLSKNNKLFNENQVRFTMENGRINLNGVPIDMNTFNPMSIAQKISFLSELPPIPSGAPPPGAKTIFTYVNWDSLLIQGVKLIINSSSVAQFTSNVFKMFSEAVQEKLSDITYKFVIELLESRRDFFIMLKKWNPQEELIVKILKIILKYFEELAQDFIRKYENEKRLAAYRPDYKEQEFDNSFFQNTSGINIAIKFIEKAILCYTMGSSGLRELIRFAYETLAQELYSAAERELRQEVRVRSVFPRLKIKTSCTDCGGHYYS